MLIIIINRNLDPRSGAHMEDLIYIYSWKGKKRTRINTILQVRKKNPKSPNFDMNNLFLYPKKEMNLIVSVLEIRLIRIKITVEKKTGRESTQVVMS